MPTTDLKNRCEIRSASSFLFFFTAIAFLAGCWASGTCVAAEESPVIRAGSELDFRPYAYTDKDGRPTGFGVELLKAVADKMGLRIRITPGPWDQAWDGLVSGRLDVLPVVARTPGREPLVDFSLPHTETFDAFFVREGRPAFPDLAAAAGKEIVVLRSDAAHHELVERRFAGKVVPVESISEGLRLIVAGKHDALLCSKLVGVLELEQADVKGVQPGPPIPDYKRVFSFAVRKGDAELLEKLNQGLRIVKATGEYERIYQRWLAAEEPWRKWLPYFQWTLVGLVVLGVLVATLQWLVRKRTRELSRARDSLQELNATLERRVAERTDALRSSLAEKDVLMRELAHRTKNNMQVIGSLLGLQAAASADEKFSSAVTDTQDRIRAMALVHENLYRSGNIASLDIKNYVEDLMKSILRAHQVAGGAVRYLLDMDEFFLSIDAALPCGLIVNELVSNSLKHAFADGKSGQIFLSLRRVGEKIELKYRDDGPGLPRDLDPSRVKSLGLKLVYNLAVRQLQGTMEIRHDPHPEFVFTFGDLTHRKGEYGHAQESAHRRGRDHQRDVDGDRDTGVGLPGGGHCDQWRGRHPDRGG